MFRLPVVLCDLQGFRNPEIAEIFRVLKPGERLAISVVVSGKDLPEGVTGNAALWVVGIGGAIQKDRDLAAITGAGLTLMTLRENHQYRFLTASAQKARATSGVKSVSLLAVKP